MFSSATPHLTLNQAWQQHIIDTYHPARQAQAQASCARVAPNPAAQQALVDAITNAAKASNAQVIKVDWRE